MQLPACLLSCCMRGKQLPCKTARLSLMCLLCVVRACWRRLAAQAQLEAAGVEAACAPRLACYASRLLHIAAAADPAALAFSMPARPGWLLLVQQASKAVAQLHTLRQLCACGGATGGAAPPSPQP